MRRESGFDHDPAATTDVGAVLASLTADDLDFEPPPPEVWLGIAAAIAQDKNAASAGPRVSPGEIEGPPEVIEYEIDARDVVVIVDEAWRAAARTAGACELETPSTDRTLWDAIGDPETRDLWKLVVEQVRGSGCEMTVPLRCDAPDARRWFEMLVSPLARGHVRFRCALQFEDPRPRIELLDPSVERTPQGDPLKVCGWCGLGAQDGTWMELEELLRASRALEAEQVPPVVYGVCGECRDDLALTLLDQSGDPVAPR